MLRVRLITPVPVGATGTTTGRRTAALSAQHCNDLWVIRKIAELILARPAPLERCVSRRRGAAAATALRRAAAAGVRRDT